MFRLEVSHLQALTTFSLQIVSNNKFDTSILNRINGEKRKREKDTQKRWAKFTYCGKETRLVTKLFKNTNVKVVYRTKNNLGKLLKPQNIPKSEKYKKNGIYQLECLTCHKKYTGQTGHPFCVRYREHYNDFKYSDNRSTFVQHVINEGHSFGPMNEIMNVIHYERKGKMLDTLEKFYIYGETKNGNQINDILTVQSNPIFETIVKHFP